MMNSSTKHFPPLPDALQDHDVTQAFRDAIRDGLKLRTEFMSLERAVDILNRSLENLGYRIQRVPTRE